MRKITSQFDTLSPRRHFAIHDWSFAVHSAHHPMARKAISIHDSNDEQDTAHGRSLTAT
ncbi:hypothetical protein FRC11_001115, partial [Ceratobasidium sp. 423]